MTGLELYHRGIRTALACWEAYARTIAGGSVHRLDGVDAAVFTAGPERHVFNNAVLAHGLRGVPRAAAIDEMTALYVEAAVADYAAWVHESDQPMVDDLTRRGFVHRETTWAMGQALDRWTPPPAAGDVEVTLGDWDDYLRVLELPAGLLADADPRDFQVAVGRMGSEAVSAAMAFDHDRDAGVFNVGTLTSARRRGAGSAVVVRLLREAVGRGATTATLQSTAMARSAYARLGFLDLGRILEFGPPLA